MQDGAKDRDAAILHWMQQLAPHGILTTDTDLRIETWNHWLEVHSDQPATTLLGKPLFEAFPELVTRKLERHFRMALEGQVSVLSTALHGYLLPFPASVRESGFEFMQQTARIGPLLSNRKVCGTICTIEDVTQREIQARLNRERADDLEEKVRERTARLNDTVTQLESFSYTVAHDLRAPIRTFKGYSDILLEDYTDELPERARYYVERMKRAAEGMDHLTRDLLQFSRISRQQVTSEPIDVGSIVDQIVAHTPALQAPGVFTAEPPLYAVVGNRTMVQQCIANLVDNALKFVAPGRPPRIRVRCELRNGADTEPAEKSPLPFHSPTGQIDVAADGEGMKPGTEDGRAEKHVRIFVEDNGIGVLPEHQRKIFGVFERLHSSPKYEGTGIGLAIVARAVQRMNGSCGVFSTPDVGSRFWIELPAAPATGALSQFPTGHTLEDSAAT